ncbi:MAG: hypothetical protein ACLPH3_12200 [Terracidiphilus sp.]
MKKRVAHKTSEEEKMQIIEYLASPTGLELVASLEGKPDEYRVWLHIPERGGVFNAKISAAEIRRVMKQIEDVSRKRGWIEAIPVRCTLTRRIANERADVRMQVANCPVLEIQSAADEFDHMFPDNSPYDPVKTFPDLTPLAGRFVLEFTPPYELMKMGYGRVAAIFTAEEPSSQIGVFPNLGTRPKWAMTVVVVVESRGELSWFPFYFHYFVGQDGKMGMKNGISCLPQQMYEDTESQTMAWNSVRDWFVAPCWHALSCMNIRK